MTLYSMVFAAIASTSVTPAAIGAAGTTGDLRAGRGAYAAPMPEEPPIPVDVDDITPAWLSNVLEVDVDALEVVDRHSGTTGRALVAVTYASGVGDRMPPTLFVKLAPFD